MWRRSTHIQRFRDGLASTRILHTRRPNRTPPPHFFREPVAQAAVYPCVLTARGRGEKVGRGERGVAPRRSAKPLPGGSTPPADSGHHPSPTILQRPQVSQQAIF